MSTFGETKGTLLVTGRIIKWKASANSIGLMGEFTKENIRMIKSMEEAYSNGTQSNQLIIFINFFQITNTFYLGLTAESTTECGRTASNTEKDCSSARKKIAGKKGFGTKASEFDGFLNNFNFEKIIFSF